MLAINDVDNTWLFLLNWVEHVQNIAGMCPTPPELPGTGRLPHDTSIPRMAIFVFENMITCSPGSCERDRPFPSPVKHGALGVVETHRFLGQMPVLID